MTRIILLCVVLVSGLSLVNPARQTYNGDKVVRLFAQSKSSYRYIVKILETGPYELDEWRREVFSPTNATIDIRVPRQIQRRFFRQLRSSGIQYDVIINDLQHLIDNEMDMEGTGDHRKRRAAHVQGPLNFTENIVGRYVSYEEMVVWLQDIANNIDMATIVDIGKSYEGKSLFVLKLNTSSPPGVVKPAIWIDGGIHAREWISPATVHYIILQLIQGYGTDPEMTKLLDSFDWYFLPLSNPDGYEYSMTTERLWRKSRSSNPRSYCRGVDLNRNFGHHWMDCKPMFSLCASGDPCKSTFAGDVPFSEKETAAMSRYILMEQQNGRFVFYFSLHSFSQYWLLPWGYTNRERPEDINDLTELAVVGVDALKRKHGTSYIMGSPANILYAAGGNSLDWAKGVANIKYSYILELRDRGEYGFLLPESSIVPTAEETFAGISAAVQYYLRKQSVQNQGLQEELALLIDTLLGSDRR